MKKEFDQTKGESSHLTEWRYNKTEIEKTNKYIFSPKRCW